jgi:hypothetical protein
MEEIIIGAPEEMQMPPEPPQKRAEEVGAEYRPNRPQQHKGRGFNQPELKQPEKPKVVEEVKVEKVSPEVAKAEAIKPNIERAVQTQKGKIVRKASRGRARPL